MTFPIYADGRRGGDRGSSGSYRQNRGIELDENLNLKFLVDCLRNSI